MKTLNIFYLVIYWTQMYTMTSFFYVVFIEHHTRVPALRKCMDTSRKKSILAETACFRRTWKTWLPSPLWAVQRHESHRGRGLASTADVKDPRRTDLGLLQELNGQYGAEHCQVATKNLYSEVRVFWTWLQDADDSLRDLHMLHCSQCTLVHPKRESA